MQCPDLLEQLVLPAAGSQAAAAGLFVVSKTWREAVQSLDIWRCIEWVAVCKVRRGAGTARAAACLLRRLLLAVSAITWFSLATPLPPSCSPLHPTRQGARHNDDALPALIAAIQRWWGARLLEFDASGSCPISRLLLTDTTLALVVAHAPRLRCIRLVGCRYVTDAGLKAVAAAAPPLEVCLLACLPACMLRDWWWPRALPLLCPSHPPVGPNLHPFTPSSPLPPRPPTYPTGLPAGVGGQGRVSARAARTHPRLPWPAGVRGCRACRWCKSHGSVQQGC